MKFPLTLIALSALSMAVSAQQPSPTESIGCKAHGDHWHCDSPRVTDAAVSMTAHQAATTSNALHSSAPHSNGHDDHDDHDDHNSSGTAGPSPTESVGCVAHGNHWDCEAPASTSAAGSGAAARNATASLSPSGSPSPVATGAAAGNGAKLGLVAVLAGAIGVLAL
ncbi:hypothetical protein FN846DRAFT_913759 [Sphaerosporella brunnea]|uniref:Uncharacterized protein n=1 Tax=Sphaerosporella brunnea TaxID=1250544 RepID=A0A5J5EES3_9PEZI|nr:hypothetical protein FN846DRAFT_913759 [Sphaerosporella brunnea]